MKLIIVRHGETDFNIRKLTQGQISTGLNENGKQQVERLAQRLKNEKIDAMYSSRLARAVETAEAINKYHRLNIVFSDLIAERRYGIFEGKLDSEKEEVIKKSGIQKHKFRPPGGGESCEDVQERAARFLDEIIHKHKNDTVLLVTHERFVQELMLHITSAPREDENKYHNSNTGFSVLEIDEDRNHKIHVLNETKHLDK